MTPIDYAKQEGIGKDFVIDGVTFKATGWAAFPKEKYHEWHVSVRVATPGYLNYGIIISTRKDEFEDGTGKWVAETIENAVNAAPVLLAHCKEADARIKELENYIKRISEGLQFRPLIIIGWRTGAVVLIKHSIPLGDFHFQVMTAQYSNLDGFFHTAEGKCVHPLDVDGWMPLPEEISDEIQTALKE